MKEWLTAKEIAAAALPQMPTTERAVQLLAEREGWNLDTLQARRRAGRGGGMEYSLGLLPLLARVTYTQAHLRVGSVAMPPAANDALIAASSATLSGRAAVERDARLAILRALDAFAKSQRLNKGATRAMFVVRYNAGSLQIEPWIRECVSTISVRTLARWRDEAKTDVNRLAVDKSANRKGKGIIETANGGDLCVHVLGLIAHQPDLPARELVRQCRQRFGDTVTTAAGKIVPMPPERTFQHAVKGLKITHKVALTKLTNPDLFRSTMKLSGVGTLRGITEPNMLWQIDASPVDALCTDGRKTVYACIDIATRDAVFYVSETPRASAVAMLIRKAILAWGVPETIKTDNGSDFVAKSTKRLFAALGIEMQLSDAYSPEQKGHVERLIRTFQHQVAPLLPGYIGHSVADRKTIESQKSFAQRLGEDTAETFQVALSGAELQDLVDRWTVLHYRHAPHAGLKNRTPYEARATANHTVRTVDERALDVLLMPVADKDGMRTVSKFGIRIADHFYSIASILPGQAVFVRMDPNDMGRVHAFHDEDGGYLGEAICPELRGIHPETFYRAQKELSAEIVQRATKEIAAERREIRKGPSLIERALEIAARDAPNVVALPRPEISHTTPEIAAALDVSKAADRRNRPAPMADDVAAKLAEMRASSAPAPAAPAPPSVAVVTQLDTPKTRFARAMRVEAALEAGEPVDPSEALWLGGYRTDPEYTAMQRMRASFGDRMRL